MRDRFADERRAVLKGPISRIQHSPSEAFEKPTFKDPYASAPAAWAVTDDQFYGKKPAYSAISPFHGLPPISLFEPIQRHELSVDGGEPQIMVTELTPVQRQIIELLGLKPDDYGR
jgi:hypothetical protein